MTLTPYICLALCVLIFIIIYLFSHAILMFVEIPFIARSVHFALLFPCITHNSFQTPADSGAVGSSPRIVQAVRYSHFTQFFSLVTNIAIDTACVICVLLYLSPRANVTQHNE